MAHAPIIRITLLVLRVVLTSGCNRTTYTCNQHMTVTVETPDGIASVSSVMEVTVVYCDPGCGLAGDTQINSSYRGEAIALEVPPGQWLFALIGNPATLMYVPSPDQLGGVPRLERWEWLAATPRPTAAVELTGELRPQLMTLGDITNRVTVATVDPDDLVATLSDNVRLLTLTLDVTQDDTMFGRLVRSLPWVPNCPGRQLDRNSFRDLRG